jgi:hypothetical protein
MPDERPQAAIVMAAVFQPISSFMSRHRAWGCEGGIEVQRCNSE